MNGEYVDADSGLGGADMSGLEAAAVESVTGTEETGGPRSIELRADENDAEGWNRLYGQLGRPESPEGYGLAESFEGHELDPQFAGAMGAAMHQAGLSKNQAQKLAAAYQEEWKAAAAAAHLQYESEKEETLKSFSPAQIEAARRAFRLSGVSVDLAESLERSIGPKAAVELFAALGAALAEDRPAQSAEGRGLSASPESVRRRIDQLMADPDFCRRYQRGDQGAIGEIETLSKRAVAL